VEKGFACCKNFAVRSAWTASEKAVLASWWASSARRKYGAARLRVRSGVLAVTVAWRLLPGSSIAVSPKSSPGPSFARGTGPFCPAVETSARPSAIR